MYPVISQHGLLLRQSVLQLNVTGELVLHVFEPGEELLVMLIVGGPLDHGVLQSASGVVQMVHVALPAVSQGADVLSDLLAALSGRVRVQLLSSLQGHVKLHVTLLFFSQHVLRESNTQCNYNTGITGNIMHHTHILHT